MKLKAVSGQRSMQVKGGDAETLESLRPLNY